MGILVTVLVLVCGAQLLLIMHLLHQEHSSQGPLDSKLPPPSLSRAVRAESSSLSLSAVSSCVCDSAPRPVVRKPPPGGVAAALLLHAPKWFQRRYTIMVLNAINNVPSNWVVQIFYTPAGQSQLGIDLNKGLKRLIEQGRVLLTEISPEVLKQRKKRFELMYHEWIWQNMAADRVLMFGGNSIMCSNTGQNLSSYDQWDYVGAPWDFKKGVGGEGSISLRNRTLMLEIISYELSKYDDALERSLAYRKWGQDDQFFVSRLLEMQKKGLALHAKLAPRETTKQFGAIGSAWNDDVMVISGTLPGLTDDERNKMIMACPDIKMVYPAMHNPACFGATPESEKCAASICALKPRTERKGGC